MKKIALIFSLFLVTGPVLAEGIEGEFMPSPEPLTLAPANVPPVETSSLHQEAAKPAPEGGMITKTFGLAVGFGKRVLSTPAKLMDKAIFWRNKAADQTPRAEAAKVEDNASETNADLRADNVPVPRLALKISVDDRIKFLLAEARDENTQSPVPSKKGATNDRLKVQFLLQDIVSTEGK